MKGGHWVITIEWAGLENREETEVFSDKTSQNITIMVVIDAFRKSLSNNVVIPSLAEAHETIPRIPRKKMICPWDSNPELKKLIQGRNK